MKLFAVVLFVFTAHLCYCYAGRALEKGEVPKHLNRLNKRPVKTIKSPDGDIIDCIHISHQPAFDHPLLKNHTIKMRPSYHPNWKKDGDIKNASTVGPLSSSTPITQLWQSNGKCPERTIPIRRTKSGSVKNYGKKSLPVAKTSSIDVELINANNADNGHEYATVYAEGPLYGGKATFNVWNPKVEGYNELSLGQLWIVGGSQSLEAGWQLDGYVNTGCYNLDCGYFMQTNNEIVIGGSISPTSQVGGSQYDITIFIWKDQRDGDWWLQVGDAVIGYWPTSKFPHLSDGASRVYFGGEIINDNLDGHHTTTQMGSSRFPEEGFGKASYVKNIQTVDESITLKTPEDLKTYVSVKSCYDIMTSNEDIDNWGSYFFYGGPGLNDRCP
ncbi:hypothetical protein L1987_83597 [Smallanthus sonchifolius]|uniref:Uncharacterized protein n=1 Tax=Smallanthus sonchifolius TaxID=185202 RepID=A0ACB8YCA4_9ASTR|nr:hypothetical protein L1987_83597 [Smallanthus sonchifolius]